MHPGRDIIVIGTSAGGVEALRKLVGLLPANLAAAVFVVMHTWPETRSFLPEILTRAGPLPARHPTDGDQIQNGVIHVAPRDRHMILERDRVLIVHGPRENRTRPAINPLFRSAASEYGRRVVGVILTGMLDDGVAGLWAIKRCGGIAVVQDPAEAAFPEMPKAALENVSIDHTLGLADIAALLVRLTQEPVDVTPPPQIPAEIQISNEGAKMKPLGMELDKVAKRSVFTCPECNGALWEVDEDGRPSYRCHVGHAYSSAVLAAEQNQTIESSLWSAVRALKESAALDERLAVRSDTLGLRDAAAAHRRNSEEKQTQVASLMTFLETIRPAVVEPR